MSPWAFRLLLVLSSFASSMLLTSTPAQAAPYDGTIVKQGQNTADPASWLVVGGQRYWIPDGGIFNCLRSSGVPGPYYLSNADLDARPDQAGQHAACGAVNDPRGSFDVVESRAVGSISLRGWATDPNVRTRSLNIHVYVGGPAGSGAAGYDLGPARAYRPDVGAAFAGDGNYHGFDTTITTNRTGSQQVCAYGINAGPGNNVLLGCRTVTIAAPSDNAIVKQGQNLADPASWLVVGGQRYWVPDGAVFNCLQGSGVPGPYYLSNADLDARPDQAGQHAACGAGNDPRGQLGGVGSPSSGSISVRGWATDPNVRTRSLSIHVYVGGQAGSGAAGYDIGAAQAYRPDVGAAFPGDGNYHGFDTTITTDRTGSQPVCAYAINAGPGNNVLLGCKTVTIAAAGEPLGTAFGAPCGGITVLAIPGSNETNEAAGQDVARGVLANITRHFADPSIRTHYLGYPAQLLPYGESRGKGYQAAWSTVDYYGKQCPHTKFAFIGYSQGAHIAGDLASSIGKHGSPVSVDRLRSVRLLADPARDANFTPIVGMAPGGYGLSGFYGGLEPFDRSDFGLAAARVTEYCAAVDYVCNSSDTTLALLAVFQASTHTTYNTRLVPGTNKTFTERMTDDLVQDIVNLNAGTY